MSLKNSKVVEDLEILDFNNFDQVFYIKIRWDNTPHYKSIVTFPHHKHIGEIVEESFDIRIPDVIKYIESKLG